MKYIFSNINYILFTLLISGTWSCTPKIAPESTAVESKIEPMITTGEEWRANAPTPAPAPEFNLGAYEEFSLDNGMKVIVVENHKLPIVSFQLFIDKGPTLEGDKAGLSSIVGEILRRGSTTKSKEEIDEAIDYIAATLSTNSSGFYASALKKHSTTLLDIATDVLFNPSFPEAEFDKIIQETKSGLTFSKSNPNTISANVSGAIRYGKDHAYGEFVNEESISNIELADVKAFYDQYIMPNNSYFIVVGDINVDEAKKLSNKYFANWKPNSNFKPHIPKFVSAPDHNSVSFIPKEGAVQSVINVSTTLEYPYNAADRLEASVMNTILGGYFGARLNKNIREDKGYTYGIGARLSPDRYIGTFSISASVRNEVTDSTITEILKEMKLLQNNKIDDTELSLVKNVLTGQFARGLESPQTIAQNALNIARYDLPKDYYQSYLTRLEKLTTDDIMKAAKKYLKPDNLNIVIVGNEEITDKLIPFDGDGKIDYYDIDANKIEKKPKKSSDNLDVSAEDVVDRYINAIGGKEKLNTIKSVIMISKAETPMGNITTTVKTKDNAKMNLKVEAQGMTVQEMVFNGMKAKVGGMQGSQIIDDPKEFTRFKEMAKIAPELDYFSSGDYQVELKGTENLDGDDVYKLVLKSIDGGITTEYYNIETGLKQKVVNTSNANGQEIVTEQKLSDYKEVNGVKLPHTVTFSGGGMPFEMIQKVESIEINATVDDSNFSID